MDSRSACYLTSYRYSLSRTNPVATLSSGSLESASQCLLRSISSFHFYDAFASEAPATLNSIPFRAAELIRNANRHPCFLGALGILPNQLRTLLKESGHVNREEALLDMSRSLFFAGFRVWTKRQQLNSYYWKHIAPQNRKITSKAAKSKSYRSDNSTSYSKCKNPFHFLVRHSNLSAERSTKCPCRSVTYRAKIYKTQPITAFIHSFPRIQSISSTDHRHFMTQADEIRKQHDRGKNARYMTLTPVPFFCYFLSSTSS